MKLVSIVMTFTFIEIITEFIHTVTASKRISCYSYTDGSSASIPKMTEYLSKQRKRERKREREPAELFDVRGYVILSVCGCYRLNP